VVVPLVLLCSGAALRPLENAVRRTTDGPDGLRAGNVQAIVESSMSVAVLGGFRALVADLFWLKAYLAWAACDPPATETMIRLVTTIDGRPLYFWLNGARIIAYDMAQWRLDSVARGGAAPAEARKRIVDEQAEAALRFLAKARRHHPDSAALCVETANIHLNCRGDVAAAAGWYRTAAESHGAPYYAARIHAELLQRLGRQQEAYDWLRRLHPTLPPDDEKAMATLVLGRIRSLEGALKVPETRRYVVAEAGSGHLLAGKD
jgi:hypothetical protein